MLSMLISDSRFDLIWFRLSCDHGWIRSGSVNVRKQQQQQQQQHTLYYNRAVMLERFKLAIVGGGYPTINTNSRANVIPHSQSGVL